MPLLDDFTRGDSTGLGANWTANPFPGGYSLPNVASNQASGAGVSTNFGYAYWNVSMFGPNVSCSCKYVSGNGIVGLGIVTSGVGTASSQGYEFDQAVAGGSAWTLYRYDNSTTSPSIGSGTRVPAAGEIFRLQLNGTLVQVDVSTNGGNTWTSIASVTDNTYRSSASRVVVIVDSGSVGAVPASITVVDDFSGDTLGVVAGVPARPLVMAGRRFRRARGFVPSPVVFQQGGAALQFITATALFPLEAVQEVGSTKTLARSAYNPILRNAGAGTGLPDAQKAGPGTVMRFAAGDYRMWYEGLQDTGGPDYFTLPCYATSTDGTVWTKYGSNPIMTGAVAWEHDEVSPVMVMYDASVPIFKMWYHGGNNSGPRQIGYATSSDGIAWTKSGSNPVLTPGTAGAWDANNLSDAKVVKVGTSDYRMFYRGDLGSSYGIATSTDGIAWTKYAGNPVFTGGAVAAWDEYIMAFCPVLRADGSWRGWYIARNLSGSPVQGSIGRMSSPDGYTWTKDPANPFLTKVTGDDPQDQIHAYVDGDKLRIVYGQFDTGASPVLKGKAEAMTAVNDGVTFSGPVQTAGGVAQTALLPFESLATATTSVSQTALLPLETVQAVSTTGLLPFEAVQALAKTLSLPAETMQGITQTGVAPVDETGGVATTSSDPVEATQGVAAALTEPYEATQGVARTAQDPVEISQGVAATSSGPAETTAGVKQTVAEVLETLTAVATTTSEPLETLTSLAATALLPAETVLGVATVALLPAETAQGVTATGTVPAETVKGVAASSNGPVDTVQGVTVPVVLPLETVQAIAQAVSEPLDATQGVTRTAADPFEALQGVSAGSSDPYETVQAGVTAVNNTAALIIETVGAVTVASVANVDGTQGVAGALASPYETLQALTQALTDPAETTLGVVSVRSVPVETAGGVKATAALFEDSTGRVAAIAVLPIDAAVVVVAVMVGRAIVYAVLSTDTAVIATAKADVAVSAAGSQRGSATATPKAQTLVSAGRSSR